MTAVIGKTEQCAAAFCVESKKDYDTTCEDLAKSVAENKFGVLGKHVLHETLAKKGIDLPEKACVFEVCNPVKASEVLSECMLISLALPCRISVFTEKGKVKVAQLTPNKLMTMFNLPDDKSSAHLAETANSVTATTEKIILEAAGLAEEKGEKKAE